MEHDISRTKIANGIITYHALIGINIDRHEITGFKKRI